METNETIDFSETVILIDCAQLNNITSSKNVLEQIAKRSLPAVNMEALINYLALDGGVRPGMNEIQVIFIYDKNNETLMNCIPSNLKADLQEVGYKSNLGEFLITSFSAEEIVSRIDLYVETVKMLFRSKTTKRLILIPLMEECKREIVSMCEDNNHKKEITILQLNDSEPSPAFRNENLLFPVMQAMGINGKEI